MERVILVFCRSITLEGRDSLGPVTAYAGYKGNQAVRT